MKTKDISCNVNIFLRDKKWFFYDELRAIREGPFETQDKVREAIINFCINCPFNKEKEDE